MKVLPTRRLMLIALAVACSGCPKSDNPSSDSSKQLVWVDKTGAVVGPGEAIILEATTLATYVDSSGDIWALNLETAEPLVVGRSSYFSDASCTSGSFVIPPAPRVPFTIGTDTSTLHVRPDDLVLSTQPALYEKQANGTCSQLGSTATLAVDATKLKTISRPSLPFAPPLRQYLRL